jgi:hypothetical protein
MAQFSRRTILAATDLLGNFFTHSGIDRFLLDHGLENSIGGSSKESRGNELAKYLIKDPEVRNEYGENLTDAVVSALVGRAIVGSYSGYPREFSFEEFQKGYPALHRALERDGFTVQGGELRRTLPEVLDLPRADDEVHTLLDQYGFTVSKGHLDQGIAAHARGDWAAANAQFRPFIESLFDSIAEHVASGAAVPAPGNQRRQWLANRTPPFFLTDLNEWSGQGTGFIEGFYRRLHPQGAHPGLSDEEDSTFRLHLVLLVARNLLRRL